MLQPILDRVLCKRIETPSDSTIVTPEQYQAASLRAEVVAHGDYVFMGGVRVPLSNYVKPGDIVRLPEYGVEDIDIDGEKYALVRIQDVKGVERD